MDTTSAKRYEIEMKSWLQPKQKNYTGKH